MIETTKLTLYAIEVSEGNEQWFEDLLDDLDTVVTWSKQDADEVTE